MATLEGFEHLESPEDQDREVNWNNGRDRDVVSEVYASSVASSVRSGQEDPEEVLTVPFSSSGFPETRSFGWS